MKNLMRLETVLGINGGNGVILHPFLKDKSFRLLANIEPRRIFATKDSKQWLLNFPNTPCIYSPTLLTEKQLKDKVDIIIGAPDCGHSSILALSRQKVFGNPKENASLTFFIKAIQHYKPKIFFMENLPALIKTYGPDIHTAFKGYKIKIFTESVSRWGNSQVTRERLVIIGVKKPHEFSFLFKLPSKDKIQLKTCAELRKNIDHLSGHHREDFDKVITFFSKFKVSSREVQQRWLTELSKHKRWPVTGRNFTSAPGIYRNLDAEYPATARKANRQYNQEGLSLTPRELARIQGVPDDFEIAFSPDNPEYWINKGRLTVTKCPPYELGTWFLKRIKKIRKWQQRKKVFGVG